MIRNRLAAREGRRFAAFYHGARASAKGLTQNPYPVGSEEANCWELGRKHTAGQEEEAPVCRFGPGGDFTRDWPGE